jgi:hypothetical protein
MAVGSGTYNFRMSAGDICNEVLMKTGTYGPQDTPEPADETYCLRALNMICKDLAIDGGPLWCIEEVVIQQQVGVRSYDLSTLMQMPLPPRILQAFLRTINTVTPTGYSDVTMSIVSRSDFNTLGSKFTPGIPNQLWYDPQLDGGIVTLYNVPNDTIHEVHLIVQRQIQDVNLLTDNPDFPQEAARMLVWALLDEVSLTYRMPPDERKEANAKAVAFKERFFDGPWVQEQASVMFTPSERTR